jgi:uncharacterized protein YxeA
MKKILLIIIFVILLIAVSWFKPAFCESTGDETLKIDDDKELYCER